MATVAGVHKRSFLSFPIGPKAVPATPTDEITEDFVLTELYLVNQSGGPLTISVYDKAGTPIALFAPTQLSDGGIISFVSPSGRFMTGGMRWSASGAGVHAWGWGT